MITSYTNRDFQFWEYRVSHGSLLVRSPKTPSQSKNIDLIFAGVEFVALPRLLRGIVLEHGNASDGETAALALGRPALPERVFVIISQNRRHIIVAAGYKMAENDGDIFDSPFA